MKKYLFQALLTLLWPPLFLLFFPTESKAQEKNIEAAYSLVKRIAPSYRNKIVFRKEKAKDGKDFYRIKRSKGKLVITANNANSMAVGFNYFLRHYCHTYVSWYAGNRITVPGKFPFFKGTVGNKARVTERFFLNYCTYGYTMPWWKWKDWERFIDWMALHGINIPLAITGQEKIWLEIWKKFGFKDTEIREYFTGPAFLPWHRMANIDRWEGPLPMSWINGQAGLQKKILKRERELGMKPVLPAFAGHVPEILKQKYPSAKINCLGNWGGFDKEYGTYFLDVFDPLFKKIQNEYLKEQNAEFGTDHLYGVDPFNEVTPPSWDPGYLANTSEEMFESIRKADPQAVLLQMGWIFYYQRKDWTNERIKAYLNAVPKGKMALLDYYCDKKEIWPLTQSFYGQPFIWCYLGNFGGRTGIEGNMKDIDKKIENTLKNGGSNLWGIGSTLEGFGNNQAMYEFVCDKAWTPALSVEDFAREYAFARAGNTDPDFAKAWKILSEKIYTTEPDLSNSQALYAMPSLDKNKGPVKTKNEKIYDQNLLRAWKLLISGASSSDNYYDDLTMVGKQVLENYFPVLRKKFSDAFYARNLAEMKKYAKGMTELISDLDRLLACNKNSLVGKWIEDAREMSELQEEKNYYETDARRIISVWGGQITDYAHRALAGFVRDYYGKRWKILTEKAMECVKEDKSLDEKEIEKIALGYSWQWSDMLSSYPSKASGGAKKTNTELYLKYADSIEKE